MEIPVDVSHLDSDSRIKIAICTRNRSESVKHLIRDISMSLSSACPDQRALLFIFDDSTVEHHSLSLASMSGGLFPNLRTVYIGRKQYQTIYSSFLSQIPESRSLFPKIMRELGTTHQWDLARVRNFSFLYMYLVSKADDKILFLDDDIRFTSVFYAEQFFEIRGDEVIFDLLTNLNVNDSLVVGVGFWGRKDMSIIEHLINSSRNVLEQYAHHNNVSEIVEYIASLPNELPIKLALQDSASAPPGDGPGGISGAVLAMPRQALSFHYLFPSYNEDWIWLRLFDISSFGKVRRVVRGVLHAPPISCNTEINPNKIFLQETGEVIYYTIDNLFKYWGHTSAFGNFFQVIDFFEQNLRPEHFAASIKDEILHVQQSINHLYQLRHILEKSSTLALTNNTEMLASKLEATIHVLEFVIRRLSSIQPLTLYKMFFYYLKTRDVWQRILYKGGDIVQLQNAKRRPR